MPVELAFVIGLGVLLTLAIPLKVNAFVSLLVSAATIGLLSGLGMTTTVTIITTGFGATVGKIGIIIIFGVALGQYLDDSRAAETLARSVVRIVGEKRSPLALALSGFLIAVPVYSDVGFVILSPLAKAISRRSRISFYILAVSLSAGLLATHVLVPPTPGPLAVAGLLGIDIGRMICWGGLVALAMTLGGWLWAVAALPRYLPAYIPEAPVVPVTAVDSPPPPAPGVGRSALALGLPLVLILLATTAAMLLPTDSVIRQIASATGNANVALFLGAAAALFLLRPFLRAAGKPGLASLDQALTTAGPIIFITAAGGSMGAVLQHSGAGEAIARWVTSTGLPFLWVPFAVSGLLKTIQGSGTVAVITAATLCLPIAQQLQLDPLLIALSAGAGARLVCHVNDSYFWVFAKMCGMDTRLALKTLTASNLAMAFSGLAATWVVSLLIS